jgi:hypothetical protein
MAVAAAGLMLFGNGATVFAQAPGGSQMEEPHEQPPPPPPQLAPHHKPTVVAPTPAMEASFWRGLRLLKCAGWTLLTCHILLAIWVFLDIRKRGEGNVIFIALVLLGGFPAAVVYSLARLGDIKKG